MADQVRTLLQKALAKPEIFTEFSLDFLRKLIKNAEKNNYTRIFIYKCPNCGAITISASPEKRLILICHRCGHEVMV